MTTLKSENELPLRERKKVETRAAIHDAALRLVAENGVGHASVDAICSEAGVSSRTFFNYFPSKVSAIVGLSAFTVTDAQRQRFLERDGERWLVRDLCTLVGSVMDATARDGVDREAIRDLLGRRPELAPDVIRFAAELRHEIVALAEQRTTPARARLAVTLVMSAVDSALHRPLDAAYDDEFSTWLFEAVMTMQAIARESLD
ncbi:TetR family transcriptional regulator [Herbiconiux sp. VKM Ac-1786]|jgi:AcrR family transcriptional regulator|uniref:TetR/AcrR family transcriptional regulator n=1 Tax=Herbiconiux sp. VKM Ac-1786 TaxID=2783824 RepID=UPI00188A871E|nr:TetR/AcrR family transcriptional regulator [Herbiconiux sp. VKM Ac-1786]MBF4574067.1 TetR family transcriptional regulator [Herbiconiux sp. VKM Ac-1786]